ncbi:MAG: glycosyltransferase [bacterium]|nr:glycosyltransferase [bacterium]
MNPPIYLSVIIPAYKEEKRIGSTLADLARYFRNKRYGYEVIVVDDGSPDATYEAALGHARDLPGLRVERLPKNRGKGYAVRHGMRLARGKYRLFMDADNSVRVDEVDAFLCVLESGKKDVVIGSIAFSYSETVEQSGFHRRFLGSLSKMMIRVVAVPGIYDSQRGFKLFTERAAKVIFEKQTIHRFGFDIEILLIAGVHGFGISELPVTWVNPPGSTVSLASYIHSFAELGHIFLNKARGLYDPEYQSLTAKASRPARLVLELSYVPRRIWHELIDSPMHLHVNRLEKGSGLVYKGKRFRQHSDLHYSETALYVWQRAQKLFIFSILFAFVLGLMIDWHATAIISIATIEVLYIVELCFNAYLAFKSAGKSAELHVSRREMASMSGSSLPRITVLCPIYQDWGVLPQLAESLSRLDYPHEKLQILLLLEEDDLMTHTIARSLGLPKHFRVVSVPRSAPRTRAKALNYGLLLAQGEYVVSYNVDDMPDRHQIKKALAAFMRSTPETACVQAKPRFYNVRQNLLTQLYSAEHSFTWEAIAPGLTSIGAPMPLGGSSDYFRTKVLRDIGGWDSFNVAEACDLGIRLAKRGYRAALIDSETRMEAVSDLLSWFDQRSRWIKGYLLTYLVHMRNPRAFRSLRHFWVFQAVVGGKIFALFGNLVLAACAGVYLAFHPQVGPFIELGAWAYAAGNILYLGNYLISRVKSKRRVSGAYLLFAPLYWLGISLAAARALYETVVAPHHWANTAHGQHLTTKRMREA